MKNRTLSAGEYPARPSGRGMTQKEIKRRLDAAANRLGIGNARFCPGSDSHGRRKRIKA